MVRIKRQRQHDYRKKKAGKEIARGVYYKCYYATQGGRGGGSAEGLLCERVWFGNFVAILLKHAPRSRSGNSLA